jgi:hypothetical protein
MPALQYTFRVYKKIMYNPELSQIKKWWSGPATGKKIHPGVWGAYGTD